MKKKKYFHGCILNPPSSKKAPNEIFQSHSLTFPMEKLGKVLFRELERDNFVILVNISKVNLQGFCVKIDFNLENNIFHNLKDKK